MAPFRTKGKPFSNHEYGFTPGNKITAAGTAWATCGPCTSRGLTQATGAGKCAIAALETANGERTRARRRTGRARAEFTDKVLPPGSLFRCADRSSTRRSPLTASGKLSATLGRGYIADGSVEGIRAASRPMRGAPLIAVGRLLRRGLSARSAGGQPDGTARRACAIGSSLLRRTVRKPTMMCCAPPPAAVSSATAAGSAPVRTCTEISMSEVGRRRRRSARAARRSCASGPGVARARSTGPPTARDAQRALLATPTDDDGRARCLHRLRLAPRVDELVVLPRERRRLLRE